jgi:hypothetical protein
MAVQNISWSSSFCGLQSLVTLWHNYLRQTYTFENSRITYACSSLNVGNQDSHPYKITGNIMVCIIAYQILHTKYCKPNTKDFGLNTMHFHILLPFTNSRTLPHFLRKRLNTAVRNIRHKRRFIRHFYNNCYYFRFDLNFSVNQVSAKWVINKRNGHELRMVTFPQLVQFNKTSPRNDTLRQA